jgi:Ca2+-binding RTX toxin-like protein
MLIDHASTCFVSLRDHAHCIAHRKTVADRDYGQTGGPWQAWGLQLRIAGARLLIFPERYPDRGCETLCRRPKLRQCRAWNERESSKLRHPGQGESEENMAVRVNYTDRYSWQQIYDGLDFIGYNPVFSADPLRQRIVFSDPESAGNRILLDTKGLVVEQGVIVSGTITGVHFTVKGKDAIVLDGLSGDAAAVLPAAAEGMDGLYGLMNDLLAGNVRVAGDRYDNLIEIGAGGKASVKAGAGNDLIQVWNEKNAVVDGGGGIDQLDFAPFVGILVTPATGVVVDLAAKTASNPFGGTLTLKNVENVIGTALADEISGDGRRNVIGDGLFDGGADVILARGGDDLVRLGPSSTNARADGGAGRDTLEFTLTDADFVLDLSQPGANADGGWTLSNFEVFSVSRLLATGQWTFTFFGSDKGETVNGSTEPPVIFPGEEGLFGHDFLHGGGGGDRLNGLSGIDELYGDDGDDILVGGTGGDLLEGGDGSDIFRFKRTTDSFGTVADTIADFDRQEKDRIDLSFIDADVGKAKNQAFRFLDTGDFTGRAGQLRWEAADGGVRVEGDTNGDGTADISLLVADVADLATKDFLL